MIIFFQVIQAYSTLLLPDDTSRLTDVSLQNNGVERAVHP